MTNGHELAVTNRSSLPEDVSGKRAKLELDAIEKDAMKEEMNDTNETSKKCADDVTKNSEEEEASHPTEHERSESGSDAEADDEVDVTSNDDEDSETKASTRLKQEEVTDEETKQQEKDKSVCQVSSPKVEQADTAGSKTVAANSDEYPASLRDDVGECKQRLGIEECEACDAAMKMKAEANAKAAMMLMAGSEVKNTAKFVKEEREAKSSPLTNCKTSTEAHQQGCDSNEERSDIAQKIYREVSEQKRCQDIINHSLPQRNIAEEIYRECRENKSLDPPSHNNNNNNNSSHNNNNHKDVKLSPSTIYGSKHVSSPPRNIAEEIYLQTKSESLLRECKGDCKKEVCCNLAYKESSPYARNIAQEIYREGHEKRQTEENLLQHHRKIAQEIYREQKVDDNYHHHTHSQHHSPKDNNNARRDIAQEIYREVRGEHFHGQSKVNSVAYTHKNNSSVESSKDRQRDPLTVRDLPTSKPEKQRDAIGSKEPHNHHHHHHHHHKDRQRDVSKDKHSPTESSPKIKTNGIDSKEDKRSRSSSPSREAKEKEKENGKYSDFMRLLAASHLQPKL